MMKFLLVILFPFYTQAQEKTIPGEVLADSNFRCIDHLQSDSSAFGVSEICNSDNYIEIRLKTYIMASSELIVLSFNNNQWVADKYYSDYITKRKKVISVIPKRDNKRDSSGIFNTIFDSLKSNKLFLIPDQRQLKDRLAILDGSFYTLTFKVGGLYRRYNYGSPEANADYYPSAPEYKQILNIITLLDSIF